MRALQYSVARADKFRSRRRSRFHELVYDGIHQRLERSIDNVWGHAHRPPMLAGLVGALDQNPGNGLGAAIEDADAIIRQRESGDETLIFAEVLAQRQIERVHWPDALGYRNQLFVANFDLHHRLTHGHSLAFGIVALLDIDVEFFDIE